MELEVPGDGEWLGVNVNVAYWKAVKLCKWNGDKNCWKNTDLKLMQSENKACRTRALLKATDEENEKLKVFTGRR